MRKLFGSRVEPACEYCKFGKLSADRKMVFCEKKGVVSTYYSCRRYVYDPLKREPQRINALGEFSKEDFEL